MTRRQIKRGIFKYCIKCGKKMTKKEVEVHRKEKMRRQSFTSHHRSCCAPKPYMCTECENKMLKENPPARHWGMI